MKADPCTITISYHNSQTGQTATAIYELGAPDENDLYQLSLDSFLEKRRGRIHCSG